MNADQILTTPPLLSTSGPPLLPGLTAASVCRKSWWNCVPDRPARCVALRMADVIERSRREGPMSESENARRDRALQAERAAHGPHERPRLQVVAVAELGGSQLVGVD